MGRLVRFLRRPRAEQRLFLRAWCWVAWVRLNLSLFPYAKVRRLAQPGARRAAQPHARGTAQPRAERVASTSLPGSSPGARTGDPPAVATVAWAVASAARFVPRATCLTQALVTERLLRQAGYAPTLRIGVARPRPDAFEAHAWVEHDGRIVIGEVDDMQRFTLVPSFPPKA